MTDFSQLTFDDFHEVKEKDSIIDYYSYTIFETGHEICIEPCMNGFCVGIYDKNKWLIAPKKCTNMNPWTLPKALNMAVEFARELGVEYGHNS